MAEAMPLQSKSFDAKGAKCERQVAQSSAAGLGDAGFGVALALLDFEEALDEGDGGGRDTGDAAGLTERGGSNARELFDHLAREAGAGSVVERCGDRAAFVGAEASHGFLLLREIAGELDLGLDGFEFVADEDRD
jgi:hypothetical protein